MEKNMPTQLAGIFRNEIDLIGQALLAVPPGLANTPWRPGGWTRKQVLGHLLDSATNNRQRFVRAATEGRFAGPNYAQDLGGCPRLCRPVLGDAAAVVEGRA